MSIIQTVGVSIMSSHPLSIVMSYNNVATDWMIIDIIQHIPTLSFFSQLNLKY